MSLPDDQQNLNPTEFDDEFNHAPWVWADMYRALGLQVIPSYLPGEIKGSYKRPLPSWADLQDALAPDLTYERWYGTKGDHRERVNMGIITGRCSGNVFVIDLDTHTHPEAGQWWQALIERHTGGEGIITACQKTGGGGIQMLFRAPVGWLVPTNKTAIGVDIRGQGGFAVMPPSKHEKGEYAWLPGNEPWKVAIAEAPGWLIEAVMEVVSAYGGASMGGRSRGERQEVPGSAYNDWGRQTDLREDKMFRMVFAVVVKWHRELNGVEPFPPDWEPKSRSEYAVYEAGVEPTVSEPGKSKTELLDMEERGWAEWHDKFKRCMNQWYGKIAEAAGNPPVEIDTPQLILREAEKAKATGKVFEFFDVPQIKAWPDPKWVIDRLVAEQAVGFIYGPSRTLKTFIALDIALCLSTGRPDWWGYKIDGGGAVVYICNEGHAFLKYRIAAWEQNRDTVADTSHFHLIKQSINFLKADDIGTLLNTVEVIADKCKQPVAAVFVDTVSKSIPGAKENLQEDMSIFIAACNAVRDKFKTVVIGIHHTNKDGGFRGSSVMPGGSDFLIETRRDGSAMAGSIFADKVKDGVDGWERFFAAKSITLSDITGTSSLVVDGVDTSTVKPEAGGKPDRDMLRKILEAISEQWWKKQPWCHPKNSPRSARINISKRWRIAPKVVEDILADWMANGIIAHEVCDAKNHISGYRKLTDL